MWESSVSNCSGVIDFFGVLTNFGSTVCAHGLIVTTRSMIARSKIECSSVWYLRTDRGLSAGLRAPWKSSASALTSLTHACTVDATILFIRSRPKRGRK